MNGLGEKKGKWKTSTAFPLTYLPSSSPLSLQPQRNSKPTEMRREAGNSGDRRGWGWEEGEEGVGRPLEVPVLKTNTAMSLSDKSTVDVMR